jgi:glutamate racemase
MPYKGKIIGVFDSGVGGLTVLKELIKLLPSHSFIYFADTKNCPYGPKGKDEIIRLSSLITAFLISQGCSTIVVACNTATAAAIDYLRDNYNIPFVGMEPAMKPAALSTKTKSIGVLATAGTFNGRLYRETTSKYAANINVCYQVGDGLVELVEQGKSNSNEARALLNNYIEPMLNENIDHLVLGCTHYPFFIPLLSELLPQNITVVNPAPAVAKQTLRIQKELKAKEHEDDLKNYSRIVDNPEPFTRFYSSGQTETLRNLVDEIESTEGISFAKKEFITKVF